MVAYDTLIFFLMYLDCLLSFRKRDEELDDVQVKKNLTYGTLPLRIKDRRTKHLRGKEIPLVKVIGGSASRENTTLELESQM